MVNRSIILTSMDLPTSKPVATNEYKSNHINKNKYNNVKKIKYLLHAKSSIYSLHDITKISDAEAITYQRPFIASMHLCASLLSLNLTKITPCGWFSHTCKSKPMNETKPPKAYCEIFVILTPSLPLTCKLFKDTKQYKFFLTIFFSNFKWLFEHFLLITVVSEPADVHLD